MNEQSIQHNFSGNAANNFLNMTLITMQIQALRESLQRLADEKQSNFMSRTKSDERVCLSKSKY